MTTQPKDHTKLLYHKNLFTVENIVDKVESRYFPNGDVGFKAGSLVKFDIVNDMFVDLSTATLNFNLEIKQAGGAAAGAAQISNACDVIKQIDISYRDVQVESFTDVGVWTNVFLAWAANRTWFGAEGSALMGINNQAAQTVGGSTRVGANQYSIPLCIISGFCRSHQYLPLLANKLSFQFQLADNNHVISKHDTAATNTYTISNVSILMNTVITTQAYRDELINQIQNGDGLRMPFSTFQTGTTNCLNSTQHNFKIQHNLSNALSLHMLVDRAAKAPVAGQHCLSRESFPLDDFSRLSVRCPSKSFTPPDDIRTFQELYRSAELCHNNFMDIVGTGWISNSVLTGGYAANADINAGTYGLCVMSINLEKIVEDDNSTINSGINAQEGFGSLDVQLNTTGALAAGDKILTCVVHRRVLIFKQGVQVDS